MREAEALPLFSTLVYKTELSFDNESLINEVNKLQFDYFNYIEADKNNNIKISKSLDIFANKKFNELKNCITSEILIYLNNILCLKSTEIKYDASWFIKASGAGRNTMTEWHFHRNSFISGIYYINAPPGSGDLQFTNSFAERNNSFNVENVNEYNIFNSNLWSIQPKESSLILFPSHATHRVSRSSIEGNRISLAFDVSLV